MQRQEAKTPWRKDTSAVVKGLRKQSVTLESKPKGAKRSAIVKDPMQMELFSATAENPLDSTSGIVSRYVTADPIVEPKAENTTKPVEETSEDLIEQLCQQLDMALGQVYANKGAPGIDEKSVFYVRQNWSGIKGQLLPELKSGKYRCGDIRRCWIDKAGGGKRALGIPNVIDRVVQEAIRRVLEPIFESQFHTSSHGFRPGKGCHTAIKEAVSHLETGREWVVDIDLKDFFNRVNHQRLMSTLGQSIHDKSLLKMIYQMIKAKIVLPDGVIVNNEEGVPQGGPLSPLLSNIVLNELDWELHRRDHRFVRYADDCNIYVHSETSGKRVMESISGFIQTKLHLEINQEKSAVSLTQYRHFLGFSLKRDRLEGDVEINLSKRSLDRIKTKIKELTPRNWGQKIGLAIEKLNAYLKGWVGFFHIVTPKVESNLKSLDAHIRRRMRAMQLKQWKTKRTTALKIERMGKSAKPLIWKMIYAGNRSLWWKSHCYVVDKALNNAYWSNLKLESLSNLWQNQQIKLTMMSDHKDKLGRKTGSSGKKTKPLRKSTVSKSRM